MTRIAHLSDCHLNSSNEHIKFDVNPSASLKSVLKMVVSDHPDGMLFTGDISDDDSVESYVQLISAIAEHCPSIPWRVIPGNHDNNRNFDTVLEGFILNAEEPWCFSNIHFLGIDTRHTVGKSAGKIRTTELFSAHTQMVKEPEKSWCLAMHHPPYALNHWMKRHECINHSIFEPWLVKQNNLKCVLHGHLHSAEKRHIADIPVLGTPSTCWQYSMNKEFAIDPQLAGYQLLEFDMLGNVTSTVKRIVAFESI